MQLFYRFVIYVLFISAIAIAFPYDHHSKPDSTQRDLVPRASVRPIRSVPLQPAARLIEPSPAIMELQIQFHIDPRRRNHHQEIMERFMRELDAAGIPYVRALEDPPHLGDSAPGGSSTTSSGPSSSVRLSTADSRSGLSAVGDLSDLGRSEPRSKQGNLSPRAQIPDVQIVQPSGPVGFPHNSKQDSNPVRAMSFQVKIDPRRGRTVPYADEHIRKILVETGAVDPIVKCTSGAGRSGKSPLRPGFSQRRLFGRGKKSRRPGRQKEASGAGSRRTRASATSALPLATSINVNPGSGDAAASSSGCTTFTITMDRVGIDPATGMPSEQFVERLRKGFELAGLNMSPAGPSGAGPSFTGSSGEDSSGVGSSGAGPPGRGSSGRGYSSAGPSGQGSSGRGSSSAGPSGRGSAGRGSSGAGPSGRGSSGAGPSGADTNSGAATVYSDAASAHSEEFDFGSWDSDTSSASSWSVVSSESIPSIGGSPSRSSRAAGSSGAGKSKPGSDPRKLSRRGKQSRRPTRIAAKASKQNQTSPTASPSMQSPPTLALSDAEMASLLALDPNGREHMSVRYENVRFDPATGQPDAAFVERIKKEGAERGWDLENLRIGHDERPLYKNAAYLKTSLSNAGTSGAGASGVASSSAGSSAVESSPHGSSEAGLSGTGGSSGAGISKLGRPLFKSVKDAKSSDWNSGSSKAGTSGAGTSGAGSSGAGCSGAGSSGAHPANPDGSSGAGTSKASIPPRKLSPRGKKSRRPTRQDRPSRKQLAAATSALPASATPTPSSLAAAGATTADATPWLMRLEIDKNPKTGRPDPDAVAHIQSVLAETGGTLHLVREDGTSYPAAQLEHANEPLGAMSSGAGPSDFGAGPSALKGGSSSASLVHSPNSGSLRLAHPPGIRGASNFPVPRPAKPGSASRVAPAKAPPTPRSLHPRANVPPPQSPPPSPTTQASSSRPDPPPAPRRIAFLISGKAVDPNTGRLYPHDEENLHEHILAE